MLSNTNKASRIATLVAAYLFVWSPAPGQSPSPPTAEALVAAKDLRSAMGGDAMTLKVFDVLRSLLIEILSQNGHVTKQKAVEICDTILIPAMKLHAHELGAAMTEIYARNYTIDELHKLLAFYHTPLGQKMINTLPLITAETTAAGQAWGKRVAREVIAEHAKELRERGVAL